MVVFFDLDDTLLDHSAAAKAAATKVHEVYRSSLNETLEAFLVRWETISEKYFLSNNPQSKLSLKERRRGRVREVFPESLSDAEADAHFQVYLDTYESRWELFPDALPCLQGLKGLPLGLITNGEKEQHRLKIKKLRLEPYFSTVVISGEVGFAKPNKEIFELAVKEARANSRDCTYIGDRLNADALASQATGMRGIWLDRKNRWKGNEVGVPVIRGLVDLPVLLKNLFR